MIYQLISRKGYRVGWFRSQVTSVIYQPYWSWFPFRGLPLCFDYLHRGHRGRGEISVTNRGIAVRAPRRKIKRIGSKAEPFVCLHQVAWHTEPVGIHEPEVELGIGETLVRSPSVPLYGVPVILRHAATLPK